MGCWGVSAARGKIGWFEGLLYFGLVGGQIIDGVGGRFGKVVRGGCRSA